MRKQPECAGPANRSRVPNKRLHSILENVCCNPRTRTRHRRTHAHDTPRTHAHATHEHATHAQARSARTLTCIPPARGETPVPTRQSRARIPVRLRTSGQTRVCIRSSVRWLSFARRHPVNPFQFQAQMYCDQVTATLSRQTSKSKVLVVQPQPGHPGLHRHAPLRCRNDSIMSTNPGTPVVKHRPDGSRHITANLYSTSP